MCNNNTNLEVRFRQEMSTQFKVLTGMRQGDALSPMQFIIDLKRVISDMVDGKIEK